MLYCDACRKEKKWPTTLRRDNGACERCGWQGSCYFMEMVVITAFPEPKPPAADNEDEPS